MKRFLVILALASLAVMAIASNAFAIGEPFIDHVAH